MTNSERNKKYRATTKGKRTRKANHLRYKFNLTIAAWEAMWLGQRGKCGLCGKKMNRSASHGVVVDHDHKTKRIRGLVHNNCNRLLGWYENNKERIALWIERS